MKKKRFICLLLMISLFINSLVFVHAEDYTGVEYDSEGYFLSPDELNADLPESSYYEDLSNAEAEDGMQTYSEDEVIVYHSEDEEPIDITDSITIESNDDVNYVPDYAKVGEITEFYGYEDTSTSETQGIKEENEEPFDDNTSNKISEETNEQQEQSTTDEVIPSPNDEIEEKMSADEISSESSEETDDIDEENSEQGAESISPYSGDFSNTRYWGTISSNKSKIYVTIHVIEKALTGSWLTFVFYDYNDRFIERYKVTTNRLSVGSHTITCNVPVHSTIKEEITLAVVGWNGPFPAEASATHYRYNFAGGAYGKLSALEGQRHHMPAKSTIAPLSSYSGPAARILTSDHKKTSSYGNSQYCKKQKNLIQQGKFLEAQEMDFAELRKLNSKYNTAIQEVKKYTKSLGYVGTVRLGWQTINNKWYYYNTSQIKQTGWKKISNVWYYLGTSGVMQTGWVKVNNTWYYLNSSGAMLTGWQNVGGTWYFLNSSGAMQTGWLSDGGNWYYLNGSGAMQTGWLQLGNTWYYLNGSGVMQTGWLNLNGTWYYLNSSGAMHVGWIQLNGIWYYLKSNGAMACNESLTISGKKYHFNASGKCTNP